MSETGFNNPFDTPPIKPAPTSSGSTRRFRVGGGPTATSFTMGETTITRDWTDVPSSIAEEILASARGAGAILEEESK